MESRAGDDGIKRGGLMDSARSVVDSSAKFCVYECRSGCRFQRWPCGALNGNEVEMGCIDLAGVGTGDVVSCLLQALQWLDSWSFILCCAQ